MSTKTVEMYRVECDEPDCGASPQDEGEFYAWSDPSMATVEAEDADWQVVDGADLHYCEEHTRNVTTDDDHSGCA